MSGGPVPGGAVPGSAVSAVPTEPAWGELWQLFHAVLEAEDKASRERVLADADPALRSEVLELLAAHEGRGDILVTPAAMPESTAAGDREDALIGQLVGPFEVQRRLGEGGMGAVYLAEQKEPIQRRVALKVVRNPQAPESLVSRFEAERQVLVMMNHPNVATAYAAGSMEIEARSLPWLAMEWVAGLPIDVFCHRFELPIEARLGLLQQALAGLAHAHRKGIVHRDVKASNVLVAVRDSQAVVKVIDFGIAKSLGAELEAPRTRFGAAIGTPGAMSPEQAAGEAVEASSDVYSAGLLAERLIGDDPRFGDVLERATLRDPTRRYRDAEEMAQALRRAATGPQPGPSQTGPSPAVPSQTGSSQAGPSPTGSSQAVPSRPSSTRAPAGAWPRGAMLVAFLLALAAAFWLLRGTSSHDGAATGDEDSATVDSTAIRATSDEQGQQVQRVPIAITVDDLPGSQGWSVSKLESINSALLETFAERGIVATGFVNSDRVDLGRVDSEGQSQTEARFKVLRDWLDAGHTLGNHGARHLSLNDTPVEQYIADIAACEPAILEVLEPRGLPLRYFRHPYLRTGPDLETKDRVDSWLASRGYTIAPVTLENLDWMFAAVYDQRLRAEDAEGAKQVAEAYLEHTDRAFAFFEQISREVTGGAHAHTYLMHVNQLNADHFDRVADIMERRGYRYVTLDEAMEDPVYRRADRYAGTPGVCWQYRWAVTEGVHVDWSREPEPANWLLKAFERRGG